jgi:hypothetical protein
MKDDDMKNVSNIKISKECFKVLKKLSIDKEISVQQVVSEILEKVTKKSKSTDLGETA